MLHFGLEVRMKLAFLYFKHTICFHAIVRMFYSYYYVVGNCCENFIKVSVFHVRLICVSSLYCKFSQSILTAVKNWFNLYK
jgi:hypothetical protein